MFPAVMEFACANSVGTVTDPLDCARRLLLLVSQPTLKSSNATAK
jgi:hypothetical protein